MSDAPCIPCRMSLHPLCDDPSEYPNSVYSTCCCYSKEVEPENSGGMIQSFTEFLKGDTPARHKTGDKMKDVLSTGRHRAAKAKPIKDGMICEWAGLRYAGGGVEPIIGCNNNVLSKQRGKYARHHGPDKSVLNNTDENLHLICPTCHNRWHTLNDPYYGDGTGDSRPEEGQTWLPTVSFSQHDATTRASAGDMLNNEFMWASRKVEVRDSILVEEELTEEGIENV